MIFLVFSDKIDSKKNKLVDQINSKFKISENIAEARGLIVIGGDGTLLRTLRDFKNQRIPEIYAINYGSIGCLLPNDPIEESNLLNSIQLRTENLKFFERKRLKIKNHGYFLNEVILTNQNPGRLNTFNIYVDERLLFNVKCDAIIVSTPSGSSAYNSSAGGPIVENECDCIIINSVSPFRNSFKNYVLNINRKIKVEIMCEGRCIIDGCDMIENCNYIEVEYDENILKFGYIDGDKSIHERTIEKIFHN